MDIEFVNPGVDYMIQRIMDVQTEAESAFWSEPLYRFYPQLDKGEYGAAWDREYERLPSPSGD